MTIDNLGALKPTNTYHSAKSLAEMGKDGFPESRVDVESTQIKRGVPVGHVPGGRDAVLHICLCMYRDTSLARGNCWLNGKEEKIEEEVGSRAEDAK
jgi:hypothetical protein